MVSKMKKDGASSKKNLKQLTIGIIVLDFVALLNLLIQIYLNDVSYSSYIVLLLCNLIVFVTYKRNK